MRMRLFVRHNASCAQLFFTCSGKKRNGDLRIEVIVFSMFLLLGCCSCVFLMNFGVCFFCRFCFLFLFCLCVFSVLCLCVCVVLCFCVLFVLIIMSAMILTARLRPSDVWQHMQAMTLLEALCLRLQ